MDAASKTGISSASIQDQTSSATPAVTLPPIEPVQPSAPTSSPINAPASLVSAITPTPSLTIPQKSEPTIAVSAPAASAIPITVSTNKAVGPVASEAISSPAPASIPVAEVHPSTPSGANDTHNALNNFPTQPASFTAYNPVPTSFAPPVSESTSPPHIPSPPDNMHPSEIPPSVSHGHVMKKFMVPVVILLIIVAGFVGSLTFSLLTNANNTNNIASVVPTAAPQNNSSSFPTSAPTATSAPNPFTSPTPTYANPFTEIAESYTNPFGTYANPFAPEEAQAAESAYVNPFEEMQ